LVDRLARLGKEKLGIGGKFARVSQEVDIARDQNKRVYSGQTVRRSNGKNDQRWVGGMWGPPVRNSLPKCSGQGNPPEYFTNRLQRFNGKIFSERVGSGRQQEGERGGPETNGLYRQCLERAGSDLLRVFFSKKNVFFKVGTTVPKGKKEPDCRQQRTSQPQGKKRRPTCISGQRRKGDVPKHPPLLV